MVNNKYEKQNEINKSDQADSHLNYYPVFINKVTSIEAVYLTHKLWLTTCII